MDDGTTAASASRHSSGGAIQEFVPKTARVGCLLLVASLCLTPCGCGRRPGPPVPRTSEISAPAAKDAAAEPAGLSFAEDDWPMWRGPNNDGVATGPAVPTTWSETQNVGWKAAIPGRGHASPIVVGDRIYLETADEAKQVQSVVCLDRVEGKIVWQTPLFEGHFETEMHNENTQATSTLACDGTRLYALFLNDRKIWATALDLDGNKVWQTEVGSFAAKFGYSASPILYQSLVLVAADHRQGGFVAALNRADGAIVWRKPRPEKSSYASPRVVTLGGRAQLVLGGCNLVSSFDPLTGESLWSTPGTSEAGVGTPVIHGDRVFASGGYPERETVALNADGSVAWRNRDRAYCPSLIVVGDALYMVNDDGMAHCYDAVSGELRWKQRLGGNFRVSPIASGGNLFSTDMAGKTTVFKANPEKFELVAENTLGTEGFASPAVSRGELFLRVADASQGTRQEWLYCIRSAKPAR